MAATKQKSLKTLDYTSDHLYRKQVPIAIGTNLHSLSIKKSLQKLDSFNLF